jgi:hypothetical protein
MIHLRIWRQIIVFLQTMSPVLDGLMILHLLGRSSSTCC